MKTRPALPALLACSLAWMSACSDDAEPSACAQCAVDAGADASGGSAGLGGSSSGGSGGVTLDGAAGCLTSAQGVAVADVDLDGFPPYSLDGCRLAYVSAATGALVVRDLLTGAEQLVAAGPEAPRRPSLSPDVLAWEASDGATNVVRVLVAGNTKTLSGPFLHAGEPRATTGAVVFTGWLQSDKSGDTDVFLFDVATGDVSLVLGGTGQQRFADVSPSHVAVSDFSEDPAGIYTGDGGSLSDVVVLDRSTLTPTTLKLPGKQAFPMLGGGQRLAYLDWLEVHPMPKLHQYELHSVPLASLGDKPTLVASVTSDVAVRPTVFAGVAEWVARSSDVSTLRRAPLDASSAPQLVNLGATSVLHAPAGGADFTVLAVRSSPSAPPLLHALPR